MVPFALSKGKPRAVPEPIAIPLENPYKKPIPKSLYEAAGDGTILKVCLCWCGCMCVWRCVCEGKGQGGTFKVQGGTAPLPAN